MLRLCVFLLAVPAMAWAAEPISPEAAQKLAQGTFHEYLELLALPNDAINPADIQRNADFLERAFKKRGFSTRQLDNKGKPMLYAEWPRKLPGAWRRAWASETERLHRSSEREGGLPGGRGTRRRRDTGRQRSIVVAGAVTGVVTA